MGVGGSGGSVVRAVAVTLAGDMTEGHGWDDGRASGGR